VFDWDEPKRAANLSKHGVDFAAVETFEWRFALIAPDLRPDCAETRFQAIGPIGERLHVLVFTPRGDVIRVISLRKANDREVESYGARFKP